MTSTREYIHYNNRLPLIESLVPLVGDKKEIKIADLAGGPYPKTGELLNGVKIELHHSDKRREEYLNNWKSRNLIPIHEMECQDMENLTYEDNMFDIVHCNNAFDHTRNAETALKEMIRVCKPSGWVYIRCWLNQHTVSHKMHFWDAKEDGTFINEKGKFNLKDYGFDIKYVDNGGELRYNEIIATFQK